MNVRLISALAAIAAVIGIAGWALVSRGSVSQPAAHALRLLSPSPLATSSGGRSYPPNTNVVFDQEFSGSQLDKSVWATCYPWADVPAGCRNFGNREYQWYLPSQVHVKNGELSLVAAKVPTNGTTKQGQFELYSCRSGMVSSYPGFRFKYGEVQIVAKIPDARGLWSGLWLAAANLKWPPEIDILEQWGAKAGVYFHPVNASQAETHLTSAMVKSLSSGWHTYSISWMPTKISWYIDNALIMTIDKNIPDQEMYLVADLADYTKSGPCTGQLAIKSIEVWQPSGSH